VEVEHGLAVGEEAGGWRFCRGCGG
jgi:hypothetical protein